MPGVSIPVKVPSWKAPTSISIARPPSGADESAVGIAAASGVFVVQFSAVDLAASLSASKLYRAVAGAASVVGRQIPLRSAFRGYVGAIAVSSDALKSAGVATFEVYMDDVASGAQLVWGNNDGQYLAFEQNVHGFVTDDEIDVRVTTDGSFAPTTVDVLIDLYLVMSNEASTTS